MTSSKPISVLSWGLVLFLLLLLFSFAKEIKGFLSLFLGENKSDGDKTTDLRSSLEDSPRFDKKVWKENAVIFNRYSDILYDAMDRWGTDEEVLQGFLLAVAGGGSEVFSRYSDLPLAACENLEIYLEYAYGVRTLHILGLPVFQGSLFPSINQELSRSEQNLVQKNVVPAGGVGASDKAVSLISKFARF